MICLPALPHYHTHTAYTSLPHILDTHSLLPTPHPPCTACFHAHTLHCCWTMDAGFEQLFWTVVWIHLVRWHVGLPSFAFHVIILWAWHGISLYAHPHPPPTAAARTLRYAWGRAFLVFGCFFSLLRAFLLANARHGAAYHSALYSTVSWLPSGDFNAVTAERTFGRSRRTIRFETAGFAPTSLYNINPFFNLPLSRMP